MQCALDFHMSKGAFLILLCFHYKQDLSKLSDNYSASKFNCLWQWPIISS